MARNNTVSAVIPTRNRPHLVLRAVKSALTQTSGEMEVIVVIDGPDAATEEVLRGRRRSSAKSHHARPSRSVPHDARNVAVESAQGDWIAFLDDDDEWLPEKTQPANGTRPKLRISVSDCLLTGGSAVQPLRRGLAAQGALGAAQRNISSRATVGLMARGYWPRLSLLAPKDLLESQHPFRPELRRHQDWDWILRAVKVRGAGIEFVARPLAIWYQAEGRKSISATADWRISFEWAEGARDLMTDRAYAGFLAATQVAATSCPSGRLEALPFFAESDGSARRAEDAGPGPLFCHVVRAHKLSRLCAQGRKVKP